MKKNGLKVLKQFFDQASDAYLILGKKKDGKAKRPYVLGWKSRHHDKLVHCQTYKRLKSIKKAFNEAIIEGKPKHHKHFTDDPQQYRLYDWEGKFLDKKEHKISEKKAKELIERVSKDYGIKVPKLKWKKKKDNYSSYDPVSHKIEMGHRDKLAVLHEMAHTIDCAFNGDDVYSYHSPAFTWVTIELYHRYAGFNMAYLVTSAHQAGLIGDMDASQLLAENSFIETTPQEKFRA